MKLTYVSIQNRSASNITPTTPTPPNIPTMGPFCPGINFVYGERQAGKTDFHRWLRELIVNESSRHANGSNGSYGSYRDASIPYQRRFGSVTLGDASYPTQIEIKRDGTGQRDLVLNHPSPSIHSINQTELTNYLNQTDGPLYDLIHGFSFRQTNQRFDSLKRLLTDRFHVPVGRASNAQAESEWEKKRQQYQALQDTITTLRQRQIELSTRRQKIQQESAAAADSRRQKMTQLDGEIETIKSQLGLYSHDLTSTDRLDQISREMIELSQQITQLSQRKVSAPAPTSVSPLSKEYFSQLYARLDELDEQIRRWKSVQEMVQQRRIKIKTEMDSWNQMTVDDLQHPYHQVRLILLDLENQVNQTDHQAKQWESNPAHHTDPSQAVRNIKQLCTSMRDGLYDLSEELNQQFTQIRHRAAASELKHLRHLFDQVAEYLNTLLEFRSHLLAEIRQTDPRSAEAMGNARPEFVQFAIENGYWQARLKYVGPWPLVNTPAVESSINLEPYHQRMAILETERNELQQRIADFFRQSDQLKSQLASLELKRKQWLMERDADLLEPLRSIDQELETTQIELTRLTNRLAELSLFPKPIANPIISRANELIQSVPEFNIDQIWLEEKESDRRIEVQLADQSVQSVGQLTAMAQDAIYLALAVAIRESLRDPRRSLPIIIDDAFVNVPRQQVDSFINLLKRIEQSGHQLILLTNHQYLADRFAGAPVFELTGPVTVPQPIFPTEREFSSEIVVTPPVRASVTRSYVERTPIDRDSNFQSWNEPPSPPSPPSPRSLHSSQTCFSSPQHSMLSDPPIHSRETVYPFSKYNHLSDPQAFQDDENLYQQDDLLRPIRIPTHSASRAIPATTTVMVEEIGDRISLAPSVQDDTLLESIQLLKIEQLRALNELHIETAADLLILEYDSSAESLRDNHISREQVANWQATIWLLSTVPGLSLVDARLLVACGILEPDQIATSHADYLLERIERFLVTREGNRFGGTDYRIPRSRITNWQRTISNTRSRWQAGRNGYSSRIVRDRQNRFTRRKNLSEADARDSHFENRSNSDRVSDWPDLNRQRNQSGGRERRPTRPVVNEANAVRPPRMATPQPHRHSQANSQANPQPRSFSGTPSPARIAAFKQTEPQLDHRDEVRNSERRESADSGTNSNDRLRFYLDLHDHIESAPSIGPKTAIRFEKIGIRTVEQFLNQTAESMASKLNYKRITPDLIRDWQHQSRLVCRIPNLRGHDAQLLVACGYLEPDNIAEMSPQKLLDVILPFSRSKEGLKIIRTGKEPDLEEISNWIEWAGKTRSLNAA
jgi:hypothetical protein